MEVHINRINDFFEEIDLFIFSSGFEKRSTKFGNALTSSQVKKSYAFHLDETYNISKTHLDEVKNNLLNTEIFIYPKNLPLKTFEMFLTIIKNFIENNFIEKKLKLVIDVTAFTREVMLILIRVLNEESIKTRLNVTIVHTPAKSYSDNNEKLWLTKGIREIRSVVGYSGLHLPSKRLLLIILNGFEEERAERIIDSFEPYKLIIGKPSSSNSINQDLREISDLKYNQLKSKFENILIEEFEFSCLSIDETKKTITQLYNKFNHKYNIVISPLNNKVSTIAVALASLENQDIQICYSSANQYNIDSPHDSCDYFLLFNLSSYIDKDSINIGNI